MKNRGLIDYMAFAYRFINLGRGILRADDINAIRHGARTVADNAPRVLSDPETPGGVEALDYAQAGMMADHIDECADWLLRLENT